MRTTILAALLLSPALALAKPTTGIGENNLPMASPSMNQVQDRLMLRDPQGSIGNGESYLNDSSHPTTGTSPAPVDTHSTAPIDDVQPGHGSTDTRQNRNPPPAY